MTIFRLAASSYTGALLTIGTSVKRRTRGPHVVIDGRSDEVGEIRAIREETNEVFVRWSDHSFNWHNARTLDRVGSAVRGPR
jgi:hypothetical protein